MSVERILLHGGRILTGFREGAACFTDALTVTAGEITWAGTTIDAPAVDRRVDLHGLLVTPGFVDSHVHATSAGLAITGVNLTGASSADDLLSRVAHAVREDSTGAIIGHGWDETCWPVARVPMRAEIDAVAGDRLVYLSRIDVHSALASSALISRSQAHLLDGYSPAGPVTRAAHHAIRTTALAMLPAAQRRRAQRAFLDSCVELGIVSVHEMAGPGISTSADFSELMQIAAMGGAPLVTGYWGELASSGGIDHAHDLGAHGVAGDLFVDGALGSHTACLTSPYSDSPDAVGAAYLTRAEVRDHVVAATRAQMQAGFHVIGDRACATALGGFMDAAETLGADAIRLARHRLEHAEMLTDPDIEVMHDLNIAASMQPLFDAMWGGEGGMYEQRLGAVRSGSMNRLRDLELAGVRLVLGSDAPVTPLGPWAAVRAAMTHHRTAQRIDLPCAVDAHTRQGWRAAGVDDAGVIAAGQQAHLAIWDAPELAELVAQDSPSTVATLVSGRFVRDTGVLA